MASAVGGSRLVGRRTELDRLRSCLAGAAAGRGGALVLVGEPGIGKSKLLDAVAGTVGAGFEVCVGQAQSLAVERPLGPVLDALGLRSTAILEPARFDRSVLEAGAGAAAALLLADRALDALEARCLSQPVVLIIEDLHWADGATLAWLRAAAERSPGHAYALLLSTRPPAPGTDVARFAEGARLERLDIGPLDPAEVAALVEDVTGAPPGPSLEERLQGAGGNPLLVHSVLEALRRDDRIVVRAEAVDGPGAAGDRTPLTAGRLLAERLTELDEPVLQALQVAAVFGPRSRPAQIGALLGWRTTDLLVVLERARAAGWLVAAGDDYAFRHDLHLDAVRATLTEPAQRALHLEAARLLAAANAPAAVVAEHYARGAEAGDPEAISWLTRAAEEIVDAAPGAALRLVDQAMALSGRFLGDDLLLLRVRALAASGRVADAEALSRTLLRDGMEPASEARLQRERALTSFIGGRAADAVAAMERHAELVTDPRQSARVSAELAFARFVALDQPGARVAAGAAVAEGERLGDVAAQVAGACVTSVLDLFANQLTVASESASRYVRLAEQPGAEAAHVYQPWFTAGLIWLEADQLDQAAAVINRGRIVAVERGAAWAVPGYDALSAYRSMRLGELDDAAAAATAALGFVEQGADAFGVSVLCLAFLAQIQLHHGDPEAASRHLAAAEPLIASGRAQLGFEQVMVARARLAERRGDPASALTDLAAAWDIFGALGVESARPQFGPDLVRLALAAGDRTRASAVAAALEEAADRTLLASVRAAASMGRALVDGDADLALAAVATARTTPRLLLLASLLAQAATLLRQAGRRHEAEEAAGEAAARFGSAGADADAAACATQARTVRTGLPRARFGFDSLTATERKVVELVAKGQSNVDIAAGLFVSRRTVESHISAAYRKLEVSSRVDVARLVFARQ